MRLPRRLLAGVLPTVLCTALATVLAAVTAACGGVSSPRPVVVEPAQDVPQVDPAAYEHFLRAELLAELAYWEEAAEELRRAIRADADAPRLHLRLARALSNVADALQEGLMACDLAADLGADPAQVALARAALYEGDGQPDAAMDVLRALPADDASPAVFQEWIGVAATSGEGDGVLEAARAFTAAFPEEPDAWRALGDSLAEQEPLEAADAYGHASRLPDPEPADAYRRIRLLVELEEHELALETATDCRQRFWEYWPCTAWQALLHDREREADQPIGPATEDALGHLAFMVSTDSRQLGQSGGELISLGTPALVAAYARIVADTRPNDVGVITSAAWFANSIEDYDLAIELMERVLVLDDANFDALNYIGYTWAERGTNLEQAEVYIREALFLRGDDGNILDSLAWVYYRMGRYDEALDVQLRAIELVDDNAVLWDHLGDIYRALGRTDDAVSAWERALDYADTRDEDVLLDAPRKINEALGNS